MKAKTPSRGGEDLSPLETLEPVSTKVRMLRGGREGEEMEIG